MRRAPQRTTTGGRLRRSAERVGMPGGLLLCRTVLLLCCTVLHSVVLLLRFAVLLCAAAVLRYTVLRCAALRCAALCSAAQWRAAVRCVLRATHPRPPRGGVCWRGGRAPQTTLQEVSVCRGGNEREVRRPRQGDRDAVPCAHTHAHTHTHTHRARDRRGYRRLR
jgi:hypothetical protein